jgi:Intraflagellar transport complex B protein 46 C terminal
LESVHSNDQFGQPLSRSQGGTVISGQVLNNREGNEELKSIFAFIDAFKPDTVPLDYRLQPFIPDYIPTIGDIDPIMQVTTFLR